MPNISQPKSLVKMLYSPTDNEINSKMIVPNVATDSFQFQSFPRERRCGTTVSVPAAGASAAGAELEELSIIIYLFKRKTGWGLRV